MLLRGVVGIEEGDGGAFYWRYVMRGEMPTDEEA